MKKQDEIPARGDCLAKAAHHLEQAREFIFLASLAPDATPDQQQDANNQMLALAAMVETFIPAKGGK